MYLLSESQHKNVNTKRAGILSITLAARTMPSNKRCYLLNH